MRQRDRRRATLVAFGSAVLAVLATGCGLLTNATPGDAPASRPSVTYTLTTPAPSTTPPTTPKTTPPPPTTASPSPSPTTPPSPLASPSCPPSPKLGLYNPDDFLVLGSCETFAGTVSKAFLQRDTDWEIDLVPDDGFETFLNDKNVSDNGNALVVQILPGQHYRIPGVGEHIEIFGSWMMNLNTGLNEFHPVWSITYTSTGVRQDSIPPREPQFSPSP